MKSAHTDPPSYASKSRKKSDTIRVFFSNPASSSKRREFMTLSEAIMKNLGSCDENKVSLVNRRITVFDKVPGRFHSVQTLFLSNNFIREIDNIKQFTTLRTLSLSHNEIDNVEQITHNLAGLNLLENLRIEGNPAITQTPLAVARIVTSLKSLKFIDGTAITQKLRNAYIDILEKEKAALDTLTQNAKEMKQLQEDDNFEYFRQREVSARTIEDLRESISSELKAKVKPGVGIREWELVLSQALMESAQQLAQRKVEAMARDTARSCKSEPRKSTLSPRRSTMLEERERHSGKEAITPLRKSVGGRGTKKRVQWSDQVMDDDLPPEPAQYPGKRLEFGDLEDVPQMVLKERKNRKEKVKSLCHSDKDLQLALSQHKLEDMEKQHKQQVELNKKISGKLKHFQKQNLENIKIAEEKISELSGKVHEEAVQREDLVGRLTDAERLINLLSEENARLTKEISRGEELLVSNQSIIEEFKYMREDGDLRRRAEEFQKTRILRGWLTELRTNCSIQKSIRRMTQKRERSEFMNLGRRFWGRWRVLFVAGLMQRRNKQFARSHRVYRGWRALQQNVEIERMRKKVETAEGIHNMRRALKEWGQFVEMNKQGRKNELVADFHWKYQLKRKVAVGLRRYIIDSSISPKQLRLLEKKAKTFEIKKLKQKGFIKLKVGNLALKHERLQNELAYTFYGKRITRIALCELKQERLQGRQTELVADMSRANRQKKILKKVFYVLWDYSQKLSLRLRLERRKEHFIWRKFFSKWKIEFEYSFTLNEKEIDLTNSTLLKLISRGFSNWVKYKRLMQMWKRKQSRVTQQTTKNIVKQMWGAWRKGLKWVSLQRKMKERRERRKKKLMIEHWILRWKGETYKKLRLKKAVCLFDKGLSVVKHNILKKWKKKLRRERNQEHILYSFMERRDIRRKTLQKWKEIFLQKTRTNLHHEKREREKGSRREQMVKNQKQNIEEQLGRLKCELQMTAVQYTDLSMNASNQEQLIKAQETKLKELEHSLKLQKAENDALKSRVDFAQIRENDIDVLLNKQRRGFEGTVKKLKKELLTLQARNEELQQIAKVAKEHKLESEQKVLESVCQEEQSVHKFSQRMLQTQERMKSLEIALQEKNSEMKELTKKCSDLREENRTLREEVRVVTKMERQTEHAISCTVDELHEIVDRQNEEKKRLHEELIIAHRQINKLQMQVKIERADYLMTPDYQSAKENRKYPCFGQHNASFGL